MCKGICTRKFHWNFQQRMDQPPNPLDCNQASHIVCGAGALTSTIDKIIDHELAEERENHIIKDIARGGDSSQPE